MKALKEPSSPVYLKELVSPYVQVRQLRSGSDPTRLCVKHSNNSYGDRTFSCDVARLWNDLPESIRNLDLNHFKGVIKTVLFKRAFDL